MAAPSTRLPVIALDYVTKNFRAVKRCYDPSNLFRLNQNITPAIE